MSTAIEFCDICKKFPGSDRYAVDHISLTVEAGEMVTILGTSGCGKTTLLKMVNRLVEPTSGEIKIQGRAISGQDPVKLRRQIGYVIQEDGLFPHMTVADNIGAVLRILGWEKGKKEKRVRDLCGLIQLPYEEYAKRYPHQLSGGQRQRVGLARALAADPELMLLDEPFGAIDAITRRSLQDELIRIHSLEKKTFLFVTHDIREAFKLGSRVLILDQGQIQQYAAPQEIRRAPANDFVKALLDSATQGNEAWI